MLCFYHLDLDGICAAAVVRKKHPKVTCVPMNYGYAIPWGEIDKHETVVIVDYSFRRDAMEMLAKEKSVIWIDHHKTSIEGLEDLDIPGIRKDGKAGCELAWEFFFPEKEMPSAVIRLGRWDVWDRFSPMIDHFQYGMRAVDPAPDSEIWDKLLYTGFDSFRCMERDKLILTVTDSGKAVLAYMETLYAQQVEAYGFITRFEGLRCIALQTPDRGSMMFKSVWDPGEYDAMIVFRWCPGTSCYTFSIYTDGTDVDVSEVAKKYGGGGHKGAAGFQTTTIPFDLTDRPVPVLPEDEDA